jgi:hypothetical protein
VSDPLLLSFPGLAAQGYRVTSSQSWRYNCIAWAASRDDRWWWPSPDGFWPENTVRAATLEAFEAAFNTLGFQTCVSADFEPGVEKIAVFVDAQGRPTHAARQLENGRWTSKLGSNVDIEHSTPDALNGRSYGSPGLFMSRRRS